MNTGGLHPGKAGKAYGRGTVLRHLEHGIERAEIPGRGLQIHAYWPSLPPLLV